MNLLPKIYEFIRETLLGFGIPEGLVNLGYMFTIAIILLTFILIVDMVLIWVERKVAGRFQQRYGPMRVAYPANFHGWAQSIADAIKLLLKEDIIPKFADRWVFIIAPIIICVPAFMVYVVVPFSKNWQVKDLNIGILYMLALSSLCVIGIIMGGWGCNNKYSLLGAFRSCAQIVSYEIPLALSIVVIIMFVGSLSMQKIVAAQAKLPFILYFPAGTLAFIIYLISAVAEVNRTPFDIPEAESELVAGYHIEYSGMKFAFFFLAEYWNMFAVSAICVTLFLGGWLGPKLPFLPEDFSYFFWFLFKCSIIIFIMMWFRWTYPRLRVDQLMSFTWKFLLPVALINIGIAGVMMLL